MAYKMERRTEESNILFATTKNYEYKQVAEVYEFYAFCKTDETSPDATPMKKLGSKINTGKDNGYSGNEAIDKDDPHYGWDIGYFYVDGYTRETATANQTPMFLKNVGDKVTLWFHLSDETARQFNLLRDALAQITPSNAVYDKENPSVAAPWSGNLSGIVTSCGNLYITSDGKDLLYEVVCILTYAHYKKVDVLTEGWKAR